MSQVSRAGTAMPTISMIVARAANGVIGDNNRLPWHLPEDLRHFKNITMGKPVIMGRKTFESIGRPLPGRLNIVLSSNPDWRAEGVERARNLDQALQLAASEQPEEIMIIGGAGVYAQAIDLADRIYVTEVHREFQGDAKFPELDARQWCRNRETEITHKSNEISYTFVTFERVRVPCN